MNENILKWILNWPTSTQVDPKTVKSRAGAVLFKIELSKHGWKQRDTAAALGISPALLSKWIKEIPT